MFNYTFLDNTERFISFHRQGIVTQRFGLERCILDIEKKTTKSELQTNLKEFAL